MKCKNCNKKIDHVIVLSKCTQKAELKGNKIIKFDGVDNVGETLSMHCPKCDFNLTLEVSE